MTWIFYWLGLNHASNGQPSQTKIAAFVHSVFGLAWACYFILTDAPRPFILAWVSLTFLSAYGLKGLTEWMRARNPVQAVTSPTPGHNVVAARRAAVGSDFEPTD